MKEENCCRFSFLIPIVPQWLCITAHIEECHYAELKTPEQSLAPHLGSQAQSPASNTALSAPSLISALTTHPEIPSFGHVTSPSCMPHLSQPITKLNLHQVTLLLADAIPVLVWPGTITFKLSMADFAHYKRNTDLQGAHKAFGDRD